ncbi:MAG: hypothetical protein HC835_07350 [Oscillatoriales cyanobacterium RM2_1_1]|nr:hypothetical protein [Oscillatoriales cyanobacterium SM2_3_0]NJO45453.1 hypothetical protein [Oscillatoriales cyanobacterium RM2_1_1]
MTIDPKFSIQNAEQIALEFCQSEWNLLPEELDWFTVLQTRPAGESWYIIEVGIEGFPDKWVLQVYDTGLCDPSYTFYSPMSASEDDSDLVELPDRIAEVLRLERRSRDGVSLTQLH